MKTLRLIGMAVIAVVLSMSLYSCSDDDDNETDNTATLQRWQNESYENITSNIVGYWAGLEWTDNYGTTWEDLKSPWHYYTFRSDGTYTEENASLTYDGKYTIYKNDKYFENQNSGDVYIDLNRDNGVSTTCYIRMLSGKLYLYYLSLGSIDYTSLNTRYTKQ